MKMVQACLLATAATLRLAGSTLADEGKDESGKGKAHKQEHKSKKHKKHDSKKDRSGSGERYGDDDYFHRYGYTRLDIPKGHFPPPGECRIWYPERPAGQQPPPGDCGRLMSRVPPGAWVIEHPNDREEVVYINAYDEHQPGVIEAVGGSKSDRAFS